MTRSLLTLTLFLAIMDAHAGNHDYPVSPVPFTSVQLSDGFWHRRVEVNRTVTIPHCLRQCEETGRIKNFAAAASKPPGAFCSKYYFDDSDVFKVIEAASLSLAGHPDSALERSLDSLIVLIAAAQESDGYLYTFRTTRAPDLERWAGTERWSKLKASHELYNLGHLYEAAAAHVLATGKRSLLDIALKSAELVLRVFGPHGLQLPPGHEEIEIGLAKLYRATGDDRFLRQARFFVDIRGRATGGRELYGDYAQDHKPVVETEEVVGHAVRAMYLYAGVADVAALTGETAYLPALERLWQNVVDRKLYVTGGVGAMGSGEAFGPEYNLPNMDAYCETCAQIAFAFFSQRLFQLHGDAKYVDVLERTLYNGLISGVGMSGDLFFYPNPLASKGQHQRTPWFACACCPPNVARFMAAMAGYVYATRGDSLYVNLFAASTARVALGGGGVTVRQQTRYPWDGAVAITVEPERDSEFALLVRIPGWSAGRAMPGDLYRFAGGMPGAPRLRVNGEAVEPSVDRGYAVLRRTWRRGDTVTLELPMEARRIVAHDGVREDAGRVAIQRGPLVYCAEWPDNPGGAVLDLLLPDDAALRSEHVPGLLNGVTVVRWSGDEAGRGGAQRRERVAIPYYAWAHRGPGEMAVWLRRSGVDNLGGQE